MTEVDATRALPLTRWEAATGLAFGEDPESDARLPDDAPEDPRAALAECLIGPLRRTPCVVSFSGGRDSSAVLAVATETARRHGLPDPLPVSLRFPGVGSTEESDWQEMVVRHLGLREWERIAVDDELNLLGDVARACLRAHGLIWPPNAHVHVPILERGAGGSLLTGVDGDGLFGDWRWKRAQAVLHGRVRPQRRDPLRVALALAPVPVRRRLMQPGLLGAVPWIRPAARDELSAILRADAAREPRRFDRRLAHYVRRRYLRLARHALDVLARPRDVEVVNPLLDRHFIAALARGGGAVGYVDRSHTMRALFGDLLPAALIDRPGKAEFGRALWKGEARDFARAWDGRGLDLELVDPEAVREAWEAPSPWFGANTLLHEAWLAAQEK